MSRFSFTEFGLVQRITLDGEPRLILLCPGCGQAARMDDDQAHGRISVDHATDGCSGGYHETHDFWAAAERAGWEDGAWNEAVEKARRRLSGRDPHQPMNPWVEREQRSIEMFVRAEYWRLARLGDGRFAFTRAPLRAES